MRCSSRASFCSWSPTPMTRSRVSAFSLPEAFINFGRSRANCSTNSLSSCWPARRPSGSVTVRAEFLPLRSTMSPLERVTFRCGGIAEPSRCGSEGRYFSPPSAQAMLSSTEVFPCPFRPPMTVRPFGVGSSRTALIRLTFSISRLLILIFPASPDTPRRSSPRWSSAGARQAAPPGAGSRIGLFPFILTSLPLSGMMYL